MNCSRLADLNEELNIDTDKSEENKSLQQFYKDSLNFQLQYRYDRERFLFTE